MSTTWSGYYDECKVCKRAESFSVGVETCGKLKLYSHSNYDSVATMKHYLFTNQVILKNEYGVIKSYDEFIDLVNLYANEIYWI